MSDLSIPASCKTNLAPQLPRTQDYRSKAFSCSQVAIAIAAYNYAGAIGRPLNLALDIHWEFTRHATNNRRVALVKLLESLRHWLGRRVGSYCVAVREHPPSSSSGEHCHLLVHVPPELRPDFLKHVRKFLRGNQRHEAPALEWKAVYSIGKLFYMLKGSTPPARKLLAATCDTDYERRCFIEGTNDKTRQGVIIGKRLLISQALGPKARGSASRLC